MAAHLVSVIDTKDFGAEQMRVGDLNGDGAPDLLFVQSVFGTREITCLTATTIDGRVLWQSGQPSLDNGRIYGDLPVQVYDWDNDGINEVLYVRQAFYADPVVWDCATGKEVKVAPARPGQFRGEESWVREQARRYEGDATMVVLDGLTGRQKASLPIPAPADDCFLFADLTGRGRREDLVVKDRYWNMWGVSHQGQVLWQWKGAVGHFPAVADVDGDGKDEVFVGFALIDHDGKVLFHHPLPRPGDHQDAAYAWRLADGSWRLAFGNAGVHCLASDGRELWQHPLGEAQHVIAARFREDSPVQFMVIDRGERTPTGRSSLYLYDLDGREVWRREQPVGGWAAACIPIDWSGAGEPREAAVYSRGPDQPVAIYDGDGRIVDQLPMRYSHGRAVEDHNAHYYGARADVWGDRREEVILFGSRGACIYANARPLAVPTLYNNTLYPGM